VKAGRCFSRDAVRRFVNTATRESGELPDHTLPGMLY
jgi:hypothetical protein